MHESMMHFTRSVDLAVVIKGELETKLPNGAMRTIKIGDVLILRGVLHQLNNRHEKEWCRVLVLVAEAKPVTFSNGKGIEGFDFS